MNLAATIQAKSDQLNADDLIGRYLIACITSVSAGNKDQPIRIDYEGGQGRPYYPSKGMRRILVGLWGEDGQAFVGKRLMLHRDPEVMFGGIKVGGIRIAQASDMEDDYVTALTISKGSKKPFRVRPLSAAIPNGWQGERPAADKPAPAERTATRAGSGMTAVQLTEMAVRMSTALDDAKTEADLKAILTDPKFIAGRGKLAPHYPELAATVTAAETNALAYFAQGSAGADEEEGEAGEPPV